jgi:predicted aspartyl protease
MVLMIANSSLLAIAQRTERLRFKLYGNHLLVVQGTLGSLKNKRNFLIDTGADPSVIDQQLAQQLNVQPVTSQSGTMDVVSGRINTRYARLSSLQVGPVDRQSIPVAVADLGFLRPQLGTHIDAIIGLDVLGQSSFVIDYERKYIFFGPVEANGAAVPFETGPPLITVPMQVDGKSVRVLVDTGTDGLVLFRNHLAGWEARLSQSATRISDLGGATSLPMIPAADTRVGNVEMGARNVYVADGHGCCDFDGLLGVATPRVKQIGFDFERKLITWQLQDRAIPTMSEAGPGNCLSAQAPGLMPRGPATAGLFEGSTCSAVPAPPIVGMHPR